MIWLQFGDQQLRKESEAVHGAVKELQDRLAEHGKTADPVRSLTVTVATNAYEDRQERNIWRGATLQ